MALIHDILKKYWLVALAIILLGLATGGVILFERSYEQRFFPRVILADEPVGGKNYEEVLTRVRLVAEALEKRGLEIAVSAKASSTIVLPAQSTGLTPDVVVEYFTLGDYEAAVRQAYEYGHAGGIIKRLREQFLLLLRPERVEFPAEVREPAIRSLLERELSVRLKPARDAQLIRSGAGIAVSFEEVGESVDISKAISEISLALRRLKADRLEIFTRAEFPVVTQQMLGPILDFTREISEKLTFGIEYNGSDTFASGLTLATWLTVKPGPGVTLQIRRDKLTDFVSRTISSRISDAPRNSRFAMRDGVLLETSPGSPGSAVAVEELAQRIEAELTRRYLETAFGDGASGLRVETIMVPITITKEQPRITKETVAAFNIQDLVGTASTSFKGSTASRVHNIETGVSIVSGLLIAPGAEFSLVEALGEVSEETGFEKEYVIKGDRSVKEAGGGLCQLATTVFRAALNAGLPITERQNHSYVVGYYGPGLDATIYGPHPDLKFVNDTGGYLLFQMRTENNRLIAEFYGQNDGRQVAIGAPKFSDYIDPPLDRYIADNETPLGEIVCTDHARRGLTAEATYTVTRADGQVTSQVFKSVYQPWPKICLVGIGISR